jgi:hypothetical protein
MSGLAATPLQARGRRDPAGTMKPAPQCTRPVSLDETVDTLARHGDAARFSRVGCLVPMLNMRLVRPRRSCQHVTSRGWITSASRMDGRESAANASEVVEEDPPSRRLSVLAGARPGRHRRSRSGTIGGSVATDPAAEVPADAVARRGAPSR